jgi:hypothetical protein
MSGRLPPVASPRRVRPLRDRRLWNGRGVMKASVVIEGKSIAVPIASGEEPSVAGPSSSVVAPSASFSVPRVYPTEL